MDISILNIDQTYQQAIACHQAGQLQEAGELYQSILQVNPKHPEANHNMGKLALQMARPAIALSCFMAALEADPACRQYWLSYIDALIQAGKLEAAQEILTIAQQKGLQGEEVTALVLRLKDGLQTAEQINTSPQHAGETSPTLPATDKNNPATPKIKPENTTPKPSPDQEGNISQPEINALLSLFNGGRLNEAAALAQELTVRCPRHGFGWLVLGTALKQMGRSTDALAPMREAVSLLPDNANAHGNLGAVLQDMGRFSEAEASNRRALQLDPDNAQTYSNLGFTLQSLGRLEESEMILRQALRIKSDFAEAYNNLGNTLKGLGRTNDAETNYRNAIQAKPDYAEAHYNLGLILQEAGQLEQAESSYRRAIQLNPGNVTAHNNLGITLFQLGRPDEAEASYRQALLVDPDYAGAHSNLGTVLMAQGRLNDAENSYRRSIQLNPDYADAYSNLGVTLMDKGRTSEAEACYRRALEIRPDYADAHTNLLFCLQFIPDKSQAEVFSEHRRFAAQFEEPLKPHWPKHPNSPDPERRLKIGYVSGDFYRHAVAYFIEPVLAHHDKSRFEVYCYYNNTRQDDFTAHLIACADHWVPCKFLPDDQLAERIRTDGIDILIDLSGHTSGNRMLMFARKPAPLQVTYLGYPGTSGLSAMDYRITDHCADPEQNECYYSEKLLRLPNCLCCYRPSGDMPKIKPLPALRNGYITFGSLNNFNKINDQCIELWAELLKAVPTSRLLMLTVPEGAAREQLKQKFAASGVASDRLELYGKFPPAEFFQMCQRADIALDPFPVTGGTTTCESLWMGIPVIVLVGQRYISRVGYSFLSAAGMQDFAAHTPQDYIKVAANLAGNIPQLSEIHDHMRTRIAASPLCDETHFTRNLENMFREIWEKWCNPVT